MYMCVRRSRRSTRYSLVNAYTLTYTTDNLLLSTCYCLTNAYQVEEEYQDMVGELQERLRRSLAEARGTALLTMTLLTMAVPTMAPLTMGQAFCELYPLRQGLSQKDCHYLC